VSLNNNATQNDIFMLVSGASLWQICTVNRKYYSLLYSSIMKNEPYNNLKHICLSGFLALLVCCCCVQARAQFIPIDSGFAEIIRLRNPAYASCINNFMLDTACAKAATSNDVILIPPSGSALAKSTKSFAGLEYFSKDYLGVFWSRTLTIDSCFYVNSMPALPNVFIWVNIKHADSLSYLPYLGDSVRFIVCQKNGFTALAALPPTLQQLQITYSKLTALPPLPATLTSLTCDYNRIAVLPSLGPKLIFLSCTWNQLTAIPALPSSLRTFKASGCNLGTLPAFGDSLVFITCDTCNLTSLPARLPDSLVNMRLIDNHITSVPPLPSRFRDLNISRNQVASLPVLSSLHGLVNLDCSRNLLTALPLLPDSLAYLECSYNQIANIIRFPKELAIFYAYSNNITDLPPLNQKLFYLRISKNPIICLPALPPNLQYLETGLTGITCLPNRPVNLNSNLPICVSNCRVNGVSGRLFADYNNNCIFDSTDVPLHNRILKLEGVDEYTSTGFDGRYNFPVTDSGTYTFKVLNLSYPYEYACTDSLFQVSYNGVDTITPLDIPVKVIGFCHNLTVDIATPSLRNNRLNKHSVLVVNTGSATAINAYIDIAFDPELIPLSSTLPWSQQYPGNVFRFRLGNVLPFQEISFSITDSVSITAPIGQTACVEANIYPHGNCIDLTDPWDSSHIELDARWEPGDPEISFIVLNTGNDMGDSSEYRIYEEELLMVRAKFKLKAMDSLVIAVPANGHTYWIEADQRPGHPGVSKPRKFVEMSGLPPFSLGYILDIAQDDDDDWVEIDCHEITAPLDPNAKEVFPAGVGTEHLITQNDQLEYILRFQNTGNDTAINVKLTDTLDLQSLDISSFVSGASSHSYTASISGHGVVTWTFANIMLPDSVRSEPASHGFVKFKIKQLPGNVPGTRINNFVDIYFDYNVPVRTNTAFVTIEEKENIFPMKVTGITEVDSRYSIQVMPNPFMQSATFRINADEGAVGELTFELLDVTGRGVLSKKTTNSFVIERGDMAPGMYFFRITGSSGLIGSGKIIAR
jgi:hypothetical protein